MKANVKKLVDWSMEKAYKVGSKNIPLTSIQYLVDLQVCTNANQEDINSAIKYFEDMLKEYVQCVVKGHGYFPLSDRV